MIKRNAYLLSKTDTAEDYIAEKIISSSPITWHVYINKRDLGKNELEMQK